ncbi:MAG: YcjF family protein [bacterium]
MKEKFLSLILYPALADGLTKKEQEELKMLIKGMENINHDELIDAITQRLSLQELQKLASLVPEKEKEQCFSLAKKIASIEGLSKQEAEALEELREALNIQTEPDDLDIPEIDIQKEEVHEEVTFEYLAKKYSMIAGVIGFLPTPFISDFTILAPLQIYMVKKISDFYNYPVEAQELLKMVIGTVGLGYTCAVTARGILAFVPIGGWILSGGIAFAGTYAIAIITQKYIKQKGVLNQETIKNIYKESYEEGKKQFKLLKDEILTKKDELLEELGKFL